MSGQHSRADWSRLVAEYKASNLTVAAFCRKYGMEGGRLYYWVKKLGGAASSGKAVSGFVRVVARDIEAETEGTPVSVRLPGAIEIRSTRYPEPDWVLSLIRGFQRGWVR